jgi:hypothetical protein
MNFLITNFQECIIKRGEIIITLCTIYSTYQTSKSSRIGATADTDSNSSLIGPHQCSVALHVRICTQQK